MRKIVVSMAVMLTLFLFTSNLVGADFGISSGDKGTGDDPGTGGSSESSDPPSKPSEPGEPSEPSTPDLTDQGSGDPGTGDITDGDSELTSGEDPQEEVTGGDNSSFSVIEVEIESITPNPAIVDEIVSFVSYIYNPENLPIYIEWNFGDGAISIGANATHSYSEYGTYTVTLTVGTNGSSFEDSESMVVLGLFSLANAGGPYFGKINDLIVFDGSDSDLEDIVTYSWNFGDGTSYSSSDPLASHVYGTAGSYSAKLTITDSDGTSESDTATVSIGKLITTIHPSVPVIDEEITVGVEAIGFSPSSYKWDFGDGSTLSGQSATHKYSSLGTFFGKLSAYSGTNEISVSFIITVSPASLSAGKKPVAVLSVSPERGTTSTIFEFDASKSYDPDGTIITYEWFFGDGGMIVTRNPKCYYTYDNPGTYTVKCVVGDNDGNYGSGSFNLKVTADVDPITSGTNSINQERIRTLQQTATAKNDLLFFSGAVNDVEEEVVEVVDDSVTKSCDLEITVSNNIGLIDKGDSAIFSVVIKDKQDSYDSNGVKLELASNIPDYENVEYYARYDSSLDSYKIDVEIDWPEDESSYSVTFTAKTYEDFSDADLIDNRYSEILSVEFQEDNEIIENSIEPPLLSGTISL